MYAVLLNQESMTEDFLLVFQCVSPANTVNIYAPPLIYTHKLDYFKHLYTYLVLLDSFPDKIQLSRSYSVSRYSFHADSKYQDCLKWEIFIITITKCPLCCSVVFRCSGFVLPRSWVRISARKQATIQTFFTANKPP
jgi:hypothetical protein